MHLLSWLPLGRKASETESAPAPAQKGRGSVSGCALDDLAPLTRPFACDPFFRLRPPFSHQAIQLSLELSNMAYTLELEPWKQAGWNDFSILIDDSLQSGLTHWESGDGVSRVVNRLKVLRAKAALKEANPVSQLLSAIRQKEKSDTIKAVCMMHPLTGNQWLLAIGFMGTGKRFYDWFSNFRFTPEEGFHRGFSQLCESFEMHTEDIVFPSAADALGLERLTLGQVLSDMRSLSSPFRLWMSGHSQGAAVMQVFTHRLITDWGVLPQNMVGYGFASPTVATGQFVYDPAAYPLYHLLNADDAVPRLGALLHLGLCLEYAPDDTFRQSVYPAPDPAEAVLRRELDFFTDGITDTPSAILHMVALMECMAQEKGAEGLTELMNSWWAIPAVDRMLWHANDKAMDALQHLLNGAREGYQALTKQPVDEATLSALRHRLRPIVQTTSTRRLIGVLTARAVPPHTLAGNGMGAYAAIVQTALAKLKPFIWMKVRGGLPIRRYGAWTDAFEWRETLFVHTAHRRTRTRRMQLKSKWRMSYHAQRKG